IKIALVGKYVELRDAYLSVREALNHAALHHDREVEILWIHSEVLQREDLDRHLGQVNGIVVPGGFGDRGIEGMIRAACYARENRVPYLGLCLGMQVMAVQLARQVFHSNEPNSTEFDPLTRYPIFDLMPDQRHVGDKGGTMRLGHHPCCLTPGTLAGNAYQRELVHERHRHRFEFNNAFRERLADAGLVFSGLSPDGRLVEICEVREHPWMLGVQFHPEFQSRPNRPHPLFCSFIGKAKEVLREGSQHPLPLDSGV
ncbi:MAG TPA: CTP synthase, partial [Dehalococcoidia bacterium]|nr:CTP synthase [Dehalococcoidia bacterium]